MSVTVERFHDTSEAAAFDGVEPISIENLTVGMCVAVVHTIRGLNKTESAKVLPHLGTVYGTVVSVPEVAYTVKEETPNGIVERKVLTSLHVQPPAASTEDLQNGLRTVPTWALPPGDSTVCIGRTFYTVEQQIFLQNMGPSAPLDTTTNVQ